MKELNFLCNFRVSFMIGSKNDEEIIKKYFSYQILYKGNTFTNVQIKKKNFFLQEKIIIIKI